MNLILVHGALGCAKQFEALCASCPPHVVPHVLEFGGHGAKPLNGTFGVDAFRDQLHQFVSEKQLQQPVVFGYSMGGYVALALAALRPELFARVITLGTKYAWQPDQANREASMLDLTVMQEKVPAFYNALRHQHGHQLEALLENTAKMMRSLGQCPVLTPTLLSKIQIPVTVAVGELDRMVSQAESIEMASAIPNATCVQLPGTKHPLEQVDVPMLLHLIINPS